VRVSINLEDVGRLPGGYNFDPRDRFEILPQEGAAGLRLGDLRVNRGHLLGTVGRVPAGALGYHRLVIDQRARGGGRHSFDYMFRVVKRLRVVFTFDDGPEADGDPNDGRVTRSPTARVLDVLAAYRHGPGRSRRGIKAAFYVLTGPELFMGKTYPKGETEDGRVLMARAAREGHLLAAHWGGSYRKQKYHHTGRVDYDGNGRDGDGDGRADEDAPYDIDGDGRADGRHALESDLLECIRRIATVTGRRPEFVRPPEWCYLVPGRPWLGAEVLATYRRLGLKMILTDAKLGDGGNALVSAFSLEKHMLARSLRAAVRRGYADIVVTMHDSNNFTAARLKGWLRRVERILGGMKLGGWRLRPDRDVVFVNDRETLIRILAAKHSFSYRPSCARRAKPR
jgi:peptidoglycan/xylan/chitin deacetylase (PgdA/CDA1 family)